MFAGQLAKEYLAFKSKYLNLQQPSHTSSYGRIHYQFSYEVSGRMEEIFKDDGHIKAGCSLDDLRLILSSYTKNTAAGLYNLYDFSPWLAQYRSCHAESLKLPLHTDTCRLVTVYAFRRQVSVLSSKNLPLHMTIIGPHVVVSC